ncbi:MAG: GNAT family N-acetyltransferase [Bacillota bacterium]
MQIRTLEITDLPAVAGLMEQLAESARTHAAPDIGLMANLHEQMAAMPEVYCNLVALVGGQVTGFISAIFYRSFFHRGGTALINELVVDRTHRGTGVGSRLVASVVDEATRRGMDEVEVGTEKTNEAARRFYRAAGFDEEYVLLGMELRRD